MQVDPVDDDLGPVLIPFGSDIPVREPRPPKRVRKRPHREHSVLWKEQGPYCIVAIISASDGTGRWNAALDGARISQPFLHWCSERESMLFEIPPMPVSPENFLVVGMAVVCSYKFVLPDEFPLDAPDVFESDLYTIMCIQGSV